MKWWNLTFTLIEWSLFTLVVFGVSLIKWSLELLELSTCAPVHQNKLRLIEHFLAVTNSKLDIEKTKYLVLMLLQKEA